MWPSHIPQKMHRTRHKGEIVISIKLQTFEKRQDPFNSSCFLINSKDWVTEWLLISEGTTRRDKTGERQRIRYRKHELTPALHNPLLLVSFPGTLSHRAN